MGETPHKFNPTTRASVIQALSEGASRTLAAKYARVGRRTLQRWFAQGREAREAGRDDDPFAEFLTECEAAESTPLMAALASVRKAHKDGQWQAGAWLLERRAPSDYGRTTREYAQARDALAEAEARRENDADGTDDLSEEAAAQRLQDRLRRGEDE